VDPLPSMKLPEDAWPFESLLPAIYPDLFGNEATHECLYRQLLEDFVKYELQRMTTKNLEGMLLTYFRLIMKDGRIIFNS
jgi:hypothetical protein